MYLSVLWWSVQDSAADRFGGAGVPAAVSVVHEPPVSAVPDARAQEQGRQRRRRTR